MDQAKLDRAKIDFLNVTFDLLNEIYKPYRKPNNKPLYINKHFSHPPNILKQLPKSIEKRILKLHQTLMYSTDELKSIMMHYMKAILKIKICNTSTKVQ